MIDCKATVGIMVVGSKHPEVMHYRIEEPTQGTQT
jgi:hypothetical protein